MASGTQNGHLGLILKNRYDWNLKDLTEFLSGNCKFNLKF